ncbi:lyase family protein [Sinomonas sp. ASV322]|uniref:lyase family protein n=1 Tax=Sinomonas sp. ASV322 TaxID=3041920 RepID=UPI0027DCA47D|nr:lyase family protein [Sinomonas sp. ASV322]MDQ4503583.1 lyase family protein [Sinomonas sp. ASV322]
MTAAFDPAADPADRGLLSPVWASPDIAGATGDAAIVAAMLELEAAWAESLEAAGLAEAGAGAAVRAVVRAAVSAAVGGTKATADDGAAPEAVNAPSSVLAFDAGRLAMEAQGGGNPVIPLVKALREVTPEPGKRSVHKGLTSQDVLDSALMLTARRVVVGLLADLAVAADSLADLAAAHRTTPQVARTLAQHSLPSSFGLKAANWLQGVAHAEARVAALSFPVQCGGAAGTNASLVALGGEPAALAADWARRAGLDAAVAPWQSFRGPVTDLGHALAAVCSAAGHVANDVMLLSRPEIGELGEPIAEGRGVSSAMPQKQNPALSALIRSAALKAPAQAMQLELAAALSEDERTGGAWHTEWPALRELLRLAAGAAAAVREIAGGLRVFPERMRANLELSGPLLVSERIMLELSGVAEGGRAGIQKAVDAALASGADPAEQGRVLRKGLRAVVPSGAADDARLDELLDPAGYQGDAAGIVDRILADYEARAARRRRQT